MAASAGRRAVPSRSVFRRLAAPLVFGRAVRIEAFRMLADLLEAELSIEGALEVLARTSEMEGRRLRAGIYRGWREALFADRFAETVAGWLPSSEAVVLAGYGRVDLGRLLAGMARVAELSERQRVALWRALAWPLLLAAGLLVLLWAAGGFFVPVIAEVSPPERWPLLASLFGRASVFLYDHDAAVLAGLVVAGLLFRWQLVAWTGPGRALLDAIAPWSLYRTVQGSAFVFVLVEFLGAGVDLNARIFGALEAHAGAYGRSRIAAIRAGMDRGRSLGEAMAASGHGFPDPSLIPVIAALERSPGWEVRLAGFVDRWVARSDRTMNRRAAVLNGVLASLAALVIVGLLDAMFSILSAAGGGPAVGP